MPPQPGLVPELSVARDRIAFVGPTRAHYDPDMTRMRYPNRGGSGTNVKGPRQGNRHGSLGPGGGDGVLLTSFDFLLVSTFSAAEVKGPAEWILQSGAPIRSGQFRGRARSAMAAGVDAPSQLFARIASKRVCI